MDDVFVAVVVIRSVVDVDSTLRAVVEWGLPEITVAGSYSRVAWGLEPAALLPETLRQESMQVGGETVANSQLSASLSIGAYDSTYGAILASVLQYLTRSALSRVESRHIRVFRLFTFPAFLSKTRQYTQDFIVPSNFHHNLDRL